MLAELQRDADALGEIDREVHIRQIATPYEKRAEYYRAMVHIAPILIWL